MPFSTNRIHCPGRRAGAAEAVLGAAAAPLAALLLLLAASGTAAAESWTLSWIPATTYADGTPITDRTVTYAVYWSTDPGTGGTMTPIANGVTQTHATFEPEDEGMVPARTVYFRMKSALNTGETSDYSAALAWVVPGTAPPPALYTPDAPSRLTIRGVPSPADGAQTAPAASSPAAWRLAWDPVTKCADGRDLPEALAVRYEVYWTRDASLAAGSLIPLALSVAIPSADFDPAAAGMDINERILFTVTAVLDTGEESGTSAPLSWRVSNRGPAPPARARIVPRK